MHKDAARATASLCRIALTQGPTATLHVRADNEALRERASRALEVLARIVVEVAAAGGVVEEDRVEHLTAGGGQAEADVGGAAGRVHAELGAESPQQREHLLARLPHRADRHHQRVDDDVGVVIGLDGLWRGRHRHLGGLRPLCIN